MKLDEVVVETESTEHPEREEPEKETLRICRSRGRLPLDERRWLKPRPRTCILRMWPEQRGRGYVACCARGGRDLDVKADVRWRCIWARTMTAQTCRRTASVTGSRRQGRKSAEPIRYSVSFQTI